ncbi:FAD-dependent oxidoreductase [Actinoplanes flavus]|uniref:NAD(P)-binding protein n=1 Tax=Actinoplanes flavus TaxID=2820290 RepID=A0ABS3V047_9ACTN|nr:FAD-dependent oxidoreductase [Actinoplanes flavus]MBO3744198.1 NAD(P)-binding protein [Actinoplanes flavus]
MSRIIVLGAGLCGLSTALLLARDGHQVTVLERDPADPPPDGEWERWQRSGVNQFRLPHILLPRWRDLMDRELPDVLDRLEAVGGLRINLLDLLPAAQRGPWQAGDERFVTVTARRPVLEKVLASIAAGAAGIRIRRGVTVTGLLTDDQTLGVRIPRVSGVLAEGGRTFRADLVVDCCGRRSPLSAWLSAAGARHPAEERADCGFVYFSRDFRTRTGALPPGRTGVLQRHESLSILTVPADNGTWSVVLIASGRDRVMRALRDPARWDAALALYPLAAHWRDGEPGPGVRVMAGIEDRHRNLLVAGDPVATGILAVGDSWACTNPSLGRGATIGLLHAVGLRDVLRDTGTADHHKLARRFHEWTATVVEPMYRATLWYDRHRLAELDADAAGTPYRTDDPGWAFSLAVFAAGAADPEIARAHQSLGSLLATPDDVVARPGLAEKIMRLGGGAPHYPLPGPTRAQLLAAVDA